MPPAHKHRGGIAFLVHGVLRDGDGRDGLDRRPQHNVLTAGNAAKNATRVVGGKARPAGAGFVSGEQRVVVLRAAQGRRRKAFAYFHALDRAHAHDGMGQHSLKLVKNGFAKPCGHVARFNAHNAAQGFSGLAGLGHQRIPLGDH